MVDLRQPAHRRPTRTCRALPGAPVRPRPPRPQLACRRRRHQQRRGRRANGGPRRVHSVHRPADPLAHRRLLQPAGAAHPRPWSCTACASAATGGENALLDHEIAYLLLRDADPRYVAALMQPDAMTIPARTDDDRRRARRRDRPGVLRGSGRRRAAHALHRAHAQHRMEGRRGGRAAAAAPRAAARRPVAVRLPRDAAARAWGCCATTCCTTGRDSPTHPARPRLVYRARYHDRIRTDALTGAGAPQRRRRHAGRAATTPFFAERTGR